MKKIVVIGTTFVDIKGYPLGDYIRDGRNAGRVEYFHGGVGRNIAEDVANVAASAATLLEKVSSAAKYDSKEKAQTTEVNGTKEKTRTAEVIYVTLVDDTQLSQDVIDRLKSRGVNTDYIKKVPNGLGTWLAVFDEHGDVDASISARAGMKEIKDILDESGDELFKDADGVLVEADMDIEIINRIAELSRKYNSTLYTAISNMSIAMKRTETLEKTRCFVCNKIESIQLLGEDIEDPKVLAERIKDKHIGAMVITLGADGCIYADNISGECGKLEAENVDVVDTTGAGDSFFAGVSYGLISGLGIKKACEIATHIAAVVIGSKENVYPHG